MDEFENGMNHGRMSSHTITRRFFAPAGAGVGGGSGGGSGSELFMRRICSPRCRRA